MSEMLKSVNNDKKMNEDKVDIGEEFDLSTLNSFLSSAEFKEDDYELVDEEMDSRTGICIGTINIFMIYFKKLFQKKHDLSILDEINDMKMDDTNRPMELLFEHMEKFNKNKDNVDAITIRGLGEFDINSCQELYSLKVNSGPYANVELGCKFIIPLISFLSEQDWKNVKWTLLPLKRSDE